jgi:hypothetical protein
LCVYRGALMVSRSARPNIVMIALMGLLVVLAVATLRGPLSGGGMYVDLIIGVAALFGSVVLFGIYRVDVSQARRNRGFREWSGPISSHRLVQLLLCASLIAGTQHIYEACLKIFVKVFE